MRTIVELTASVLQNFLIIWFISEYCGYKYDGIKKYVAFLIILAADCVFIAYINRFIQYDGVLSAISILMYIVYCLMCLKREWYIHIFISCFAMAIVFVLCAVIFLFMSIISNIPLDGLYENFTWQRVVALVLCMTAIFGTFKFILYLNKAYHLSWKEWLLFSILLIFTWLDIILFNQITMKYNDTKLYTFIAVIFMVIINVFMYYFVLKINEGAKANTELELLKMQYDNVNEMEGNLRELYDSAYALKHDLEKHFIAIKAKAEENDDKSVVDYVNSIINKYSEYVHKTIFTNNNVFNAIINVRLEICKYKNILTRIKIEKDALDGIKDEDVAVLFGNIFDNAIEAADKTKDKLIVLEIQKQESYISIYMENSFDGIFNLDLKTKKTSAHEHGIGMKNVKKIVSEYNGMMKCFAKKNMFCCDILLEICKI